eukprot:403373511
MNQQQFLNQDVLDSRSDDSQQSVETNAYNNDHLINQLLNPSKSIYNRNYSNNNANLGNQQSNFNDSRMQQNFSQATFANYEEESNDYAQFYNQQLQQVMNDQNRHDMMIQEDPNSDIQPISRKHSQQISSQKDMQNYQQNKNNKDEGQSHLNNCMEEDEVNPNSTSVVLLNQKKQTPIESLIEFSNQYNTKTASKKELCHEHKLRKTCFCTDCRLYICDRCLPMSQHAGHNTLHLSMMAYKVLEGVKKEQMAFEENLQQLQKVNPQLWQSQIRNQMIQLFDGFQEKLNILKQQAFRQLNAVIKSMNFSTFVQDIESLQQSRVILQNQFEALTKAFDDNHFSQIAKRSNHYRSYIESLEILNFESLNMRKLVEQKSVYMQKISTDLRTMKLKLQEAIKIISKSNLQQNDLELLQDQKIEIPKTQVITPFYLYMKENQKQVKTQFPNFCKLEIVGQLQNQWQKENKQVQYSYERRAQIMCQEQSMKFMQPSPVLPDAPTDANKPQILNICGVKRVFNIIYCSKLSDFKSENCNQNNVNNDTARSENPYMSNEQKREQKRKYKKRLLLNQAIRHHNQQLMMKDRQQISTDPYKSRAMEQKADREKDRKFPTEDVQHVRHIDRLLKHYKIPPHKLLSMMKNQQQKEIAAR